MHLTGSQNVSAFKNKTVGVLTQKQILAPYCLAWPDPEWQDKHALGWKKVFFPFYACCLILNEYIKGKIYCSASTHTSWALVWESKWHIVASAVGFLLIGVSSIEEMGQLSALTQTAPFCVLCVHTVCDKHPQKPLCCRLSSLNSNSTFSFIPAAAQYNLFWFCI